LAPSVELGCHWQWFLSRWKGRKCHKNDRATITVSKYWILHWV